MARASRSSKKQPAFDPSELEDLIFSPAVGSGVGSHLLTPEVELGEDPSLPNVSTVATSTEENLSTVDTSKPASILDLSTVVKITTVDNQFVEEANPQDLVSRESPGLTLWITEDGEIVPRGRVRRIRLAQDVINSAEESVYDTLWTAKGGRTGVDDSSRLVQVGYDHLAKRTRLAKRTIQRIISKLIDKDFIAIEEPADIYRRTSTTYRVFSYRMVLEKTLKKGRTHVAKIGPGFSYVRAHLPPETDVSTVDILNMPTVDNTPTVTVDNNNVSTVDRESITYIGRNVLEQGRTTSSGLTSRLRQFGVVDDDVVRRLIVACQRTAPDCTEEEIAHFVDLKGALIRASGSRIYNPLGFLLTAVPKCFQGDSLRTHREQQTRDLTTAADVEAEQQLELEAWRREQIARLSDPKVTEEEKTVIRECLGDGLNAG